MSTKFVPFRNIERHPHNDEPPSTSSCICTFAEAGAKASLPLGSSLGATMSVAFVASLPAANAGDAPATPPETPVSRTVKRSSNSGTPSGKTPSSMSLVVSPGKNVMLPEELGRGKREEV